MSDFEIHKTCLAYRVRIRIFESTKSHWYSICFHHLPYTNANSPGLTAIGPPMWQAEDDTDLTLSASPATAVGQLIN